MTQQPSASPPPSPWLYRWTASAKVGSRVRAVLALTAFILAVAGFTVDGKRAGLASLPLFYAGVGFGGFLVLALAARVLRALLSRDGDYYDR